MSDAVGRFLLDAEQWLVYDAAVIFMAGYPLLAAIVWVVTAAFFYGRQERGGGRYPDDGDPADLPPVTVVVPAYNEEAHILETVEACLAIDYPDLEILVVDDGSQDSTHQLLEPWGIPGRIRLLAKEVNEGKALALNDALHHCAHPSRPCGACGDCGEHAARPAQTPRRGCPLAHRPRDVAHLRPG